MKLVGKKVVLRYLQLSDAKSALAGINDPSVLRTIGLPDKRLSLKKEIKWLKEAIKKRKKHEEIQFAIIDKKTKSLIGVCGFNCINKHNNFAIIGCWIARKYWNSGYATDAIKLLIKYGFQKMKLVRIEAYCRTMNKGSWKAQKKAGMQREGILRKRGILDGKNVDDYIYSIIKSEWKG